MIELIDLTDDNESLDSDDFDSVPTQMCQIRRDSELQFFVEEDTCVTLELLEGSAEICGVVLRQNTVYRLPALSSIAIFSLQDCNIKISGRIDSVRFGTDVFMKHLCFMDKFVEVIRKLEGLKTTNVRGPISLVVGPTNVDRSSFCYTMLNYSLRFGRRPVFVDLDVCQSLISIPGTISILPVGSHSDHAHHDGCCQSLSVYPFGYMSPARNLVLYLLLIKKLGALLKTRLQTVDRETLLSGVIINSCGWDQWGEGYSVITLAARAFEVRYLYVLEDEPLCLRLKRDLPSSVTCMCIPKRFAMPDQSPVFQSRICNRRLWQYFYGPQGDLNLREYDVKFSEVKIVKVIPIIPPNDIDTWTLSTDDVAILPVAFSPYLTNMVVALSLGNTINENLLVTKIKGFVYITRVDMQNQVFKVLSRFPAPLPGRILILGDIRLELEEE